MAKNSIRQYSFRSPNSRSSILVMAIWIMVFFSILGLAIYGMVSSQIMLTRSLEERIACPNLARAAYICALQQRKNDSAVYDTILKLGKVEERESGMYKFTYSLSDEESKVNINTVSQDLLARLPGMTAELAQGLADSSLRPFRLKEEALLVEGMNKEIYDKFKDITTVYSAGQLNLNTASSDALKVLGLDDAVVLLIEDFRKGADGKEGSEDDGFFENTAEITSKLSLSAEQAAEVASILGLLCVNSKNYTLSVETQILSRPAMRFQIVMDKLGIKEWQEF